MILRSEWVLLSFFLFSFQVTEGKEISCIFYLFKFQSAVSGKQSLFYITFWDFFNRNESKGLREM